jgi:cob(I)alamin adenosyltransferase
LKKKFGYGDAGETSIYGGKRLKKSSLVIGLLGALDELNSYIGICRTMIEYRDVDSILREVQKDMFKIGNEVQAIEACSKVDAIISSADVSKIEEWLIKYSNMGSHHNGFILPGGSRAGAHLHMARAICRRVEGKLVEYLTNKGIKDSVSLPYINRLGDLLYVLARYVTMVDGGKEEYL